ncbi:BadF/BadG/BcrA/BcrD ATPase family protein [Pelagicoccus sp. SDUM812002]|uniref:BadF/BadG/BcrA/BcrD ATPase family protein n=1 Tax=Pelagicoccus sp. SDUM812002 TaxID=3041266 RepID=UPI00280F741C|nr:BadF/BadG/BcrA/BcrD ATPase family protein [Pelagicoccus sp. SDUM812002]MDQ8184843.1 BadF/BadG/BcrA/BcrD ATPase family protein [Pelagicoccus sp. SDUM812002]
MNAQLPASVFIGIDGGGTQTRAIAIDETGDILGRGTALGSNPNNNGFSEAAKNIVEAINNTGATLGVHATICLGIAGLASPQVADRLRDELLATLPSFAATTLHLTHDLEIAHYAAFRDKPGIVLIAGTGSACFAKNSAGESFRASGRNFPYEDPGSGYAIGKRAIDSKLLLAVESRPSIAALAPRVIELATHGDQEALDILRLEAQHLAKLAKLVFDDYAQTESLPIVAVYGGLLTSESLYRDTALSELHSAIPGIKVIDTTTSPAQAAAELAKSRS